MRRHILLYTLLCGLALGLPLQTRGQTPYSYRYWIDNDEAAQVTGTVTGEESFDIDLSATTVGIHALHLQTQTINGVLSSIYTHYFLKTSDVDATRAEYWFDNDMSAKQSVTLGKNMVIDVTTFTPGLHTFHYQTVGTAGVPSSCQTYYFVKIPTSDGVMIQYWFDNDVTTLRSDTTTGSAIDLDVSELGVGLHTVHIQTLDSSGVPSTTYTHFLYIENKLLAKIWIDENTDNAKTYEMNGDSIVIDVRKLKVGMHTLSVTLFYSDGQTIGTQTVEFEVFPRMKTITLTADLETFSCDDDLNFQSVDGLRAYTAAGFNRTTSDVIMLRVNDVPAYTGLLLVGTAGTTYQVPCEESPTVYVNMLAPTLNDMTIAAEADGYLNYLLDTENGLFAQAGDEGSFLEANRAYLRLPSSSASDARRLKIRFGTEPCDVNEDDEVNTTDIVALQRIISFDIKDPKADVNGDGRVNVADIMTVLNRIARKK